MRYRIYIGWDPREEAAYRVAAASAHRLASQTVEVHPVMLKDLQRRGLYTRGVGRRDGKLWDAPSDAPMATEFAVSRFFLPHVAGREGFALFVDCDVLFRRDPIELFRLANPARAVQVVQHPPIAVADGEQKMDGQAQLPYLRKNWSSVMLWNLGHPAHDALTLDALNTAPGRDLHRFHWLDDGLIGALPPEWNWLEGYSRPMPWPGPALVHLTRGGPWMQGWDHVPYAVEWLAELGRMQLARRG